VSVLWVPRRAACALRLALRLVLRLQANIGMLVVQESRQVRIRRSRTADLRIGGGSAVKNVMLQWNMKNDSPGLRAPSRPLTRRH
jgi:hypothetical protein